jgi:hypothetical protein
MAKEETTMLAESHCLKSEIFPRILMFNIP